MKPISTTRQIQSPIERVFETISDVRNFSQAVPDIIKIEFVTEQQTGVGTRFLETRLMNGKEQTVELEVAEFVENDRVRMVSDAGGIIWDTLFTVQSSGDETEMKMVMDVKPKNMMSKMMAPMIMPMVKKGVEADMDSVKEFCESK